MNSVFELPALRSMDGRMTQSFVCSLTCSN